MSNQKDRITFEKTVLKEIQGHSMISPSWKVLVALSGGADSVCLFRVLLALRETLSISVAAVHVNHGLRETAQRDADFVSALCESQNVPLHLEAVNVRVYAGQRGLGLEEAARILRYEVFERARKELSADCIALAHHRDDQAETILFHLCRGCGVEGLRGIQPVRDVYIRPLLGMGRREIEDYLAVLQQTYVIDETNEDTAYKRNMLRHTILPLMSEHICYQTASHIFDLSQDMANLEDYLTQQLKPIYKECVQCEENRFLIDIPALWVQHPYMQRMVIKKCLCDMSRTNKDIARVHVEDVLSLFEKQSGRTIHLPYGMKVTRNYDRLYLEKASETEVQKEEILLLSDRDQIPFEKQIPLWDEANVAVRVFACPPDGNIPRNPYTKWFDYAKINGSVVARMPGKEDYLFFDDSHKKSVFDYMKNEKIPVKERMCRPVIACGQHVLYIFGGRISNAFKVTEHTKWILEICVLQ